MNKSIQFNFRRRISRRTLLRGVGVSMAIPWLSAMEAAFASPSTQRPPQRFVALTLGLGLHAENLNPTETGRGYRPSRYLRAIDDLRDQFTVISGTSHPGVTGGHRAEASILTARPVNNAGGGKNSISLDQHMAKYLGDHTRFPSLILGSAGSNSPSYTENGSMIPAQDSPSRLFTRLFIDDSPAQRALQAERVREGRSIMDLVTEDAARLTRELGSGDRQRLDAYFTSVRDLEIRMAAAEAWANRPKPKVDYPKPIDIGNACNLLLLQRKYRKLFN